MQRQLALKTFFLRQHVLRPLLAANDNQTLLRGVQGGGFLEKDSPGRRRQEAFPGFLAHLIIDVFIKACLFYNAFERETNQPFSRSKLWEYACFSGMPPWRVDLFQWLSSAGHLLPESLQWILDDIAWLLFNFNFKRMGFTTANPGIITGEQLQWHEYFFLPYYDNLLELSEVKEFLQREGIFSDWPAPLKNKERGDNV